MIRAAPYKETDIAITGIGCRFPGDEADLESFDDFAAFVHRGGDGVKPIPADRWDRETFFNAVKDVPGRMYTNSGAFLSWDYRMFDASAFGMSKKEAADMDPQQRLILEVALDSLYDAGVDFSQIEGSRTGVFIGGFMLDHYTSVVTADSWERNTQHSVTSGTMTMLANRLSYVLGLGGPSLTVDTACSSSLVALHLACRSLQAGDADACLVGGVNFMLRPQMMMSLCRGHFLAEDGRSKSFDAAADGYGRGEGCGIVYLERLQDAKAAGRRIYGTVLATGVNQDGRTNGISVPNGEQQFRLMQSVLNAAQLRPGDINFFEAHGTGTPVGDPIEVNAIRRLVGEEADSKVPIGSVKSGLGHQEAAAGVCGLLKVLSSFKNRAVPKQAWLQDLNPALNLNGGPLVVPVDSAIEIPADSVAAINSFGYGGTNAHAVVKAGTV